MRGVGRKVALSASVDGGGILKKAVASLLSLFHLVDLNKCQVAPRLDMMIFAENRCTVDPVTKIAKYPTCHTV
jgi:hypothetical protein